MRRIIIRNLREIRPFNELARDLRIQNKPLWLHQRDLFETYVDGEFEFDDWKTARTLLDDAPDPLIIHRDNIYFNESFLNTFIKEAKAGGKPVQVAFSLEDEAIRDHVYPLSTQIKLDEEQGVYLADMWYLPEGINQLEDAEPLIIDTEWRERGYYHIPQYTASAFGDLVYKLPKKAFVVVESWVHVFVADILFGIFTYGVNIEDQISKSWRYKAHIMLRSIWEQKPFLSSSVLLKVGKNVRIHPTAQITGPTIIGDNVEIGAGVVIDACIIGNNVTIAQGAQLHISVVGDGCFLPFRSALFMTAMMEDSMVAQNTCLQLCVVGRQTFIGAGTTFTDTSLITAPLKALNGHGELEEVPFKVLGGCVGHHCHLGSGLIIYPGRTIESDVILIPNDDRQFISKNVTYAQSDHLLYPGKFEHERHYEPMYDDPVIPDSDSSKEEPEAVDSFLAKL